MRSTSPMTSACARLSACLFFTLYSGFPGALAQGTVDATASGNIMTGLSYADLADLAVAAPLVVRATVTDVIPLSAERAVGVPQGHKRVYVEGRVLGLIRGEGGLAPDIAWLYDAPVDARGRLPKLKKRTYLLFARPGTRAGQIQLIAPDAQKEWSPALEARTKSIVAELLAARVPPVILGVGDAFHVAGTVAGEGETQIFLRTQGGSPVSLSIVRRPGESPHWAVALGEIVDEAATEPKHDTLLWYRLACALPRQLPDRSVRTLSVMDAEAARADYALVLSGLGPCGRTVEASANAGPASDRR